MQNKASKECKLDFFSKNLNLKSEKLIDYCLYIFDNLQSISTQPQTAAKLHEMQQDSGQSLNEIKGELFIDKYPLLFKKLSISDEQLKTTLTAAISELYYETLENSSGLNKREHFEKKLRELYHDALEVAANYLPQGSLKI